MGASPYPKYTPIAAPPVMLPPLPAVAAPAQVAANVYQSPTLPPAAGTPAPTPGTPPAIGGTPTGGTPMGSSSGNFLQDIWGNLPAGRQAPVRNWYGGLPTADQTWLRQSMTSGTPLNPSTFYGGATPAQQTTLQQLYQMLPPQMQSQLAAAHTAGTAWTPQIPPNSRFAGRPAGDARTNFWGGVNPGSKEGYAKWMSSIYPQWQGFASLPGSSGFMFSPQYGQVKNGVPWSPPGATQP